MSRTDGSPTPYWLDDADAAPQPMTEKKIRRSVLLIVSVVAAIGVVITVGLLIPATVNVRHAAARAQSQNNLKQMGIGFHNIASVYNGLEPPVVGRFPSDGPELTLFFHLLPHLESSPLYGSFCHNPTALTPAQGTCKIYCAPADPSNPGTQTLRLSYCVNGAVFDGQHGGKVRFPAVMDDKGITNTILVFERFAAPNGISREWNDPNPRRVWLYSPYDGFDDFPYESGFAGASVRTGFFDWYGHEGEVDFGKQPDTVTHVHKPHAFNSTEINVLLGDGSARAVSTTANATFDVDGQPARYWAWACSVQGSLGQAKVPNGW
jgi:hypothetical protein